MQFPHTSETQVWKSINETCHENAPAAPKCTAHRGCRRRRLNGLRAVPPLRRAASVAAVHGGALGPRDGKLPNLPHPTFQDTMRKCVRTFCDSAWRTGRTRGPNGNVRCRLATISGGLPDSVLGAPGSVT